MKTEEIKQAEKKCIEKVEKLKREILVNLKFNSLPEGVFKNLCEEDWEKIKEAINKTNIKVIDKIFSDEQKLTNHNPKEQTKPDRVKSDKGRSNAVILQNETPIRRDKSVSAETIKTQEKRNE